MQEDFTHLAIVLYKAYCQSIESMSRGPWKVTTKMVQEIQYSVDKVFSQFTVYSKDLDSKLQL